MATKLTVMGLTLRLPNGQQVLEEISLEIRASKLLGIIGPSGSGKSTFLRCLNRLWEPPAETVFLDNVDITTLDVIALRQRVGMIFQQAHLFAGTVAANIRYGPALSGRSLTTGEVDELLQMAGLTADFAQRPAAELSGGEAQRVALARALANRPEVLLLDEPTSALDPAATQQVEETIRRLQALTGLTVVMVSHDVEQVQRLADSAALLVNGRVIEAGPVEILAGGQALAFAEGKLK